jgi:hypothetical protein
MFFLLSGERLAMPKNIVLLAIAFVFATVAAANAQQQLNPYGNSSNSPRLYAPDGTFLGNVNSNPYDPNSIANPYGQYGSPYSPNSINNPYGQYGSPYSPNSVNNPYAH